MFLLEEYYLMVKVRMKEEDRFNISLKMDYRL